MSVKKSIATMRATDATSASVLSEATARPWIVDDHFSRSHHRYDEGTRCITAAEGSIAICATTRGWESPKTSPANAALIVRAVNSHDALVKALEEIAVTCADYAGCEDDWVSILKEISQTANMALNSVTNDRVSSS